MALSRHQLRPLPYVVAEVSFRAPSCWKWRRTRSHFGNDVYVSDFSSRAFTGQQLDVLAPGSWVRGPFESGDGYSHLPWWSKSLADLKNTKLGNFYYVGGTSMATPHVASVAALILEKAPTLKAADVEQILKSTALAIPNTGTVHILNNTVFADISWDTNCNGTLVIPWEQD